MIDAKKFYLSKTIIFNVLVLATGLAGLFGFVDFTPGEEAQQAIDAVVALVAAGVPVFNIILRIFTTKPVKL